MKIGIIGGAGVAATNKLCELIEEHYTTNGAFRDEHHPEMIIYQATKVPSRSMYLEGKGPSFIDGYITIGNKLKDSGADVIAMCCNTAHYAIDVIQESIGIPFINMIEEVVRTTKNIYEKNIGLIASDGCLKGKVYEKYFERIFPEANLIYPETEFQQEVTKGICNIKNKSRFLKDDDPNRPKNIFKKIVHHLESKGAKIVIIGCTDIRVEYQNTTTVDSLEVLATKIIEIIDMN